MSMELGGEGFRDPDGEELDEISGSQWESDSPLGAERG